MMQLCVSLFLLDSYARLRFAQAPSSLSFVRLANRHRQLSRLRHVRLRHLLLRLALKLRVRKYILNTLCMNVSLFPRKPSL